MRYIFARLDEKRKLFGNFEKILKENSIEKNDFSVISGKVVAKYRALENNTRFLQHFFPISTTFPFQAPMQLMLCSLIRRPEIRLGIRSLTLAC